MTACRINLHVEINSDSRILLAIIHNSVLFLQMFAAGTIAYMDGIVSARDSIEE